MNIPVETFALENGLRVTISEDHTVPVVAVNLWYHVGSANERPGRSGFAHLFEHMLFQGSAHVAAKEHFELIQRAGGTLNGSTWLDRTNYFETVPANHLALALWLEADRMGQLLPAMTQAKLDNQRDVVQNERRWTIDNQPYGTWFERLPALAFPTSHPFHHSLMGSMEDLNAASLDDVAHFFRMYYTPDNAVLTIAGDADPEEVRQLVTGYFGSIPRGPARPPLTDLETGPVFGTWLREVVPDNVMVPRLFLAFRTPVFGSQGYYAASMCGAVLGLRIGSRLHRALVREQRVASAAIAYTFDLAKGSDLLVIDVTAQPGMSGGKLESAVVGEVDRLIAGGISAAELERAVALIETDYLSALQSAGSRADLLSKFATYFGDPALVNAQVALHRAVSLNDVRDFAQGHLRADNRLSLLYVPHETNAVRD